MRKWPAGVTQGDCRKVLRQMVAKRGPGVHLTFTSPPYNVDMPYEGYKDSLPYDEYLAFIGDALEAIYEATVDSGRLVLNVPNGINVGGIHYPINFDTDALARKAGFKSFGTAIWHKQFVNGRTAWGSFASPSSPSLVYSWEFLQIYYKGERKMTWDRPPDITPEQFTEWSYARWKVHPKNGESATDVGHPAPFPEEIVKRALLYLSFPGMTILDPFCGSGTTLAVARRLDRNPVGIDISPKYAKMSRERLKATGIRNPGKATQLDRWATA